MIFHKTNQSTSLESLCVFRDVLQELTARLAVLLGLAIRFSKSELHYFCFCSTFASVLLLLLPSRLSAFSASTFSFSSLQLLCFPQLLLFLTSFRLRFFSRFSLLHSSAPPCNYFVSRGFTCPAAPLPKPLVLRRTMHAYGVSLRRSTSNASPGLRTSTSSTARWCCGPSGLPPPRPARRRSRPPPARESSLGCSPYP